MSTNDSDNLMSEEDINRQFEELLNEMNLTEEKKEPLRSKSLSDKKKMLKMHSKSEQINQKRSRFVKPMDYISSLQNFKLTSSKLNSCLESLRIALKNNPLSWGQEFAKNQGLDCLLTILKKCQQTSNMNTDKIQHEIIKCIKEFMNHNEGFELVLNHEDALMLLVKSINSKVPNVMIDDLTLLAGACFSAQSQGHLKVIEAITKAAESVEDDTMTKDRFSPIIDGFRLKNDSLNCACFILINAILTNIFDLDFRLHLRNELLRTGFRDILEKLTNQLHDENSKLSAELTIQLNAFNNSKNEDFEELVSRFENINFHLEDAPDCFNILYNSTKNTPSEMFLLSILQHLLVIRDDPFARPAYFRLIEECVSQIVLHKDGFDPDFRHGKKVEIDVDNVIATIVERSKQDDERKNNELHAKLEESLTAKEESEAKLAQLEVKHKELEKQFLDCKQELNQALTAAANSQQTNNIVNNGNNQTTIKSNSIKNNISNGLPSSNGLTTNGPVPPPPPMPGQAGPGFANRSVPPPPPPMPGMGIMLDYCYLDNLIFKTIFFSIFRRSTSTTNAGNE